jgi:hypothetical protein
VEGASAEEWRGTIAASIAECGSIVVFAFVVGGAAFEIRRLARLSQEAAAVPGNERAAAANNVNTETPLELTIMITPPRC